MTAPTPIIIDTSSIKTESSSGLVPEGGGSGGDQSSSNASSSADPYMSGSSETSTTDRNDSSTNSVRSQFSKLSKEEQDQLAEKETQLIQRSRVFFVVLLLVITAVAAVLTYYFVHEEETKTFQAEFQNYAHEVQESTDSNAARVHDTMDGFAVTVTSFSLFEEVNWPNLTMPHFPIRGQVLKAASGADKVMLSPIVTTERNDEWESFAENNHQWIDCLVDIPISEIDERFNTRIKSDKPREEILAVHSWISESTGIPLEEIEDIYQVPAWQMYPMEEEDLDKVNFDLLSHPSFHRLFHWIMLAKEPVLSEVIDVPTLFGLPETGLTNDALEYKPQSLLIQPIYTDFSNEYCKGVGCRRQKEEEEEEEMSTGEATIRIGALAIAVLPWDTYLTKLLPHGVNGIYVVLRNTCGDVFTYQINGPDAIFLGPGDHHETDYDPMVFATEFNPFIDHDDETTGDVARRLKNNTVNCQYVFDIYPSEQMEEGYHTNKPALLTFVVAFIFVMTTLAFVAYDCLVQRRQEKVMDSALRSNAIVSSLFPAEVRNRLFAKQGGRLKRKKKHRKDGGSLLPSLTEAPKFRLNHFLAEDEKKGEPIKSGDPDEILNIQEKPIADLFPNATVMFADIAGFTAWSSVREPAQVFTLLETVYRAFDHIAKRRRVFKVETIGDSYVAVSGLPEPCEDHAIVMARFARDCLAKMNALTTKLEEVLGPDTGDLTMRFGLNSGPVTAGVLRGEKSRFQLFGDTVNTAARMESLGIKNRIQMSEETADLLVQAGKGHWCEPRGELVHAKGKGELQTYWLITKDDKKTSVTDERSHRRSSEFASTASDDDILENGLSSQILAEKNLAKKRRMVDWTVDILFRLLRQIVATRDVTAKDTPSEEGDEEAIHKLEDVIGRGDRTVQEEVTEFVYLPKFNKDLAEQVEDASSIELKPEVKEQLHLYVTEIAKLYNDNPFHNFEHASHVTMSIHKLLVRIVAADIAPGEKDFGQCHILARLHQRTYGITSDPLTQFAAVFSGLIHDVDHRGVPNFVLEKEEPELAAMYKARSIAEQNSVDIAWEMLMEEEFKDLRRCIYSTTSELRRFRQTVVNTIMATDIFDKGFADLRKRRWERCFHDHDSPGNSAAGDDVHRKATIVIEHLIQASDVAHTMQHWQIYQKWNTRLFQEMYGAYIDGRLGFDPSARWYESELGFFDNYIIPLAKKLKECGVFGVASDEYLNYAVQNRREWSNRGQDMVAQAVSNLKPPDNRGQDMVAEA